MRRNRRCPLLRRDTCAQTITVVRKEDDDKRAAIFGRFLTLGPFLPVHWLEWKRLEGHGKASLSSRSAG